MLPNAAGNEQGEGIQREDMPLANGEMRLQREQQEHQAEIS